MTQDKPTHNELRHISTLAELEAALEELSPEEQALAEAMSFPPTPEEIKQFRRDHPHFTENVMALLRERRPELFEKHDV